MTSNSIERIPVDQIAIGDRLRILRQDRLAELSQSISVAGMIHPISVVVADGGYRLVSGHHRLEAAKLLGWTEVPSLILDADDLVAELVEIDENLHRVRLSYLERGEHLHRRSQILEALGRRARRGRPEKRVSEAHLATTASLAEEAGIARRTAQRNVQLVRSLPQDIRDLIRPTTFANSEHELSQIANIKPAADRLEAARLLASGEVASVYSAKQAVERRYFACATCGEIMDGYEYHHARPYHCATCGAHSPPTEASSQLCGRCGAPSPRSVAAAQAAGLAAPSSVSALPPPQRTPRGLVANIPASAQPPGEALLGKRVDPFYRKGGYRDQLGRVDLPLPDESQTRKASKLALDFADAVDALTDLDVDQIHKQAEQPVVKLALRKLHRWLDRLRVPADDAETTRVVP